MKRLVDYSLNEELTAIQLAPVTRLDLIQYAGASGDFNPIHTIDEEAEKAGLPGVIAHGMWTMGNLSKLFTSYYEEGFIQDYSVRFRDIVRLDDVLTLKGTFMKREQDKLYFDVTAINQDQRIAVKGQVVFKLYT